MVTLYNAITFLAVQVKLCCPFCLILQNISVRHLTADCLTLFSLIYRVSHHVQDLAWVGLPLILIFPTYIMSSFVAHSALFLSASGTAKTQSETCVRPRCRHRSKLMITGRMFVSPCYLSPSQLMTVVRKGERKHTTDAQRAERQRAKEQSQPKIVGSVLIHFFHIEREASALGWVKGDCNG